MGRSMQSIPYWLDSTRPGEGLGSQCFCGLLVADLTPVWCIETQYLEAQRVHAVKEVNQEVVSYLSFGNPSTRRNGVKQKNVKMHLKLSALA